uniref:Uncharacterized protein n=1 Tax=Timema monikensis TaxID=170555 RepID=A0A7R9HUS1_9NEOP|nr:unnamed protein product [Timema monikensis]
MHRGKQLVINRGVRKLREKRKAAMFVDDLVVWVESHLSIDINSILKDSQYNEPFHIQLENLENYLCPNNDKVEIETDPLSDIEEMVKTEVQIYDSVLGRFESLPGIGTSDVLKVCIITVIIKIL